MSESLSLPSDSPFSLHQKFMPKTADSQAYGSYELSNPMLLAKPRDVADDHLAYNPSGIWTVRNELGETHDVLYARVEPDRSDAESSHLGRSVIRPYVINVNNPEAALTAYPGAQEFTGEDAALTRIKRRSPVTGELEEVWLLSYVDPRPFVDRPNEVETLCTRFWVGADLANLEHVADGPEGMKDIRIAQADRPLGTELVLYGRPQTMSDSGNITHVSLPSIDALSAEAIANAPYIDEDLLPIGSGVWGGVNDIVSVSPGKYILAAHRAWRTGPNGYGRHYEAVLYGHDTVTNRIVDLGVFATANMFTGGIVKDDTAVDLKDVVFTGGSYNGKLEYMTFGVSDGNIGVSGLRRTL